LLKRRDSGGAEQAPPRGEEKNPGQQSRHPVSVYVLTLFAAVMLLILLSHLISQRNSSQTISDMTEQHDRFSIQALENIEMLQDKNIELIETNESLEARVEELEAELADVRQRWSDDVRAVEETLKNDYSKLLVEYQTVQYLLNARLAHDSGDIASMREQLALIEAAATFLPAQYAEEYARLTAAASEVPATQ